MKVVTIQDSKAIAENLENYLESYASTFPLSGGVIVASNGVVLAEKYKGFADRKARRINDSETVFPIASLSKAFTAAAILKLAEYGQLDIHRPPQEYLPEWVPTIDERITIHHLLSHSSGLPDYMLDPGEKLHEVFARPMTQHAFCKKFLGHDLLFEPGEKFAYSNPGYYVLGMIIENISEMSFENFLQQEIWMPLGMRNTLVDNPLTPPRNRANPYDFKNQKIVDAPATDARNFFPQGGICSTLRDLVRWEKGLTDGSVLSPENVPLMFHPYVLADKRQDAWYGYGWGRTERFGQEVWSHGGSHWGYRSQFDRYPESGLVVVALSNYGFQAANKLARIAGAIALGQPFKEAKRPERSSLPDSAFDSLLGDYSKGRSSLNFTREGASYFIAYEDDRMEVFPINETIFYHAVLDDFYEFEVGPDGIPSIWGMGKTVGLD